MYGAHTSSALRGDYRRARADFTVEQGWHRYSAADQVLWRRLYERQCRQLADSACEAYIDGLARAGSATRIPDLKAVSDALTAATGWRLVAVPGFIPDAQFFAHLAARQFPVTVWLRKPEEIDYLVEPDIFHDFFGHVPMLFDPHFADFVQRYGEQGLHAITLDALPLVARLYWYTVEFGLIETPKGLRAYGAGILSSAGETAYALDSAQALRIRFDLQRCMRTRYRIDAFQKTYFVIQSLDQLMAAIDQDLDLLLTQLRSAPELDPEHLAPGDRIVAPRRSAMPIPMSKPVPPPAGVATP
ncbi:phenylalanine 4-monooxygenase [Sinimarinibacterium sp. CAU 1509]|uniref:phenylalanine 4-monooxygenase n=1 Tax=Sinimarinibacterium sp. CAU 1509 TaxID=2562283 RepID=UPI0010ACE87D|nr:phenylalanine 4-monooxygenase [Sinimarinibacterium sp. CAU 1509]TJY64707.1 phenylalanine 4-monooxygenase [Sinimarinibacterium sp. CAU 1509]